MTKPSNHYVDNKKFYEEISKYHYAYHDAVKNNEPLPKIPEYLGVTISALANNYANKHSFRGYSYLDMMIDDAIENCIRYLHKFDPTKTNNPFAYFTRAIYFSFLQRIETEKKESYVKYKLMENSIIMNTLADMPEEDAEHFNTVVHTMDYEKLGVLAEKFEKKKSEAKNKPAKGVELFFDEDEVNDGNTSSSESNN